MPDRLAPLLQEKGVEGEPDHDGEECPPVRDGPLGTEGVEDPHPALAR